MAGEAIAVKMGFAISDALVAAVLEANSKTAGFVREVARVMQAGVGADERSRAHQTLVLEAQEAILERYDEVVTRPSRTGPYRKRTAAPNNRYAGGVLRDALGHRSMVEWDENGFGLIDVTHLDRTARHWARLNAGAGGVGKGSRMMYDIRLSNLVVASIGIIMAPRPAFFIPRGYWWKPGEGPYSPDSGRRGQDEFYPVGTGPRRNNNPGTNAGRRAGGSSRRSTMGRSETRVSYQTRRPTRGIVARNFLDAGPERIAARFGDVYEEMYRDFYAKKIVTIRPPTNLTKRFTLRSLG